MLLNTRIIHYTDSEGFLPDEGCLATSSTNKFYPFYILCGPVERLGQSFLYNKPSKDKINNVIGRYDHLFLSLNSKLTINRFEFTFSDTIHHIFVLKHCILNEKGQIILLMTFDDESLLFDSVLREENKEFEDKSKFKLFVSTEFLLEPKYTNVWKKLDKEYISKCYKKGIRVEFTISNKIDQIVFKNNLNINFTSVNDLVTHLSVEVPQIFREVFYPMPIFGDTAYNVSMDHIREYVNFNENPVQEVYIAPAWSNEAFTRQSWDETASDNHPFEIVDDTVEQEVDDLPF